MKCPRCLTENRDDSKFFSNCAAPLGRGAGADVDGFQAVPEKVFSQAQAKSVWASLTRRAKGSP